MKTIPAILQTHYDEQVQTTCMLLKITRNVGAFGTPLPDIGVCTLDKAITYDDGDGSITYSAMAGFVPSSLSSSGDMGVDNAEAEILVPAFDLGPVVESDINAGRYDSAPFVLYKINYNDLTSGRHEIIMAGTLGQAKVVGGLSAFCELRSISQQFKQSVCEVDSLTCRADFGSTECGIDADALFETGEVTALGTETDRVFASDTALAEGALVPGIVQWLTGDNAGRSYEIESHAVTIGGGGGGSPGDDDFASVSALLHFNGADASTTFTDVTGKTWTAAGNAQIDTSQLKYGSASGLFDGTTDYISTPDSADFDFGSGDFTLEFWLRPGSVSGFQNVIGKRLVFDFAPFTVALDGNKVRSRLSANGSSWAIDNTGTISVSTSTWVHVAIVKDAGTFRQYVGGVQDGSGAVGTLMTNSSGIYIGAQSDGASAYNGHMDDMRITKGVCRYPSGTTFTPPTAEFYDSAPSGGSDLGTASLTFPTHFPIEVGDTFKWRPDCGKQFIRDCKDIYSNALNFRGEPYIPVGDEMALSTPGATKPGANSGTVVNDVTVAPV